MMRNRQTNFISIQKSLILFIQLGYTKLTYVMHFNTEKQILIRDIILVRLVLYEMYFIKKSFDEEFLLISFLL